MCFFHCLISLLFSSAFGKTMADKILHLNWVPLVCVSLARLVFSFQRKRNLSFILSGSRRSEKCFQSGKIT